MHHINDLLPLTNHSSLPLPYKNTSELVTEIVTVTKFRGKRVSVRNESSNIAFH